MTNLAPEKDDFIDVIVVDDRPAEQEEIRQILKEECGCNAIFYADYRNAYRAVLEQVGHRLLVNYQLGGGGKDLGAALLQKLEDNALEVPTIVINCRPKDRRSVSAYCARFAFVSRTIEAQEIHNHVAVLRHTFRKGVSQSRPLLSSKPKVFVIHGRDVKAVNDGKETALSRFARILKVNLDVEVVILKGEAFDGRTLIEQIEGYVREASVVIALFTADDIGCLSGQTDLVPRARQNVVFEAGFARGYLGAQQTVIFRDHDVELPSDLGGIRTLNISEPDDQIVLALKQVFDKLGIPAPLKRI